MLDGSRSIRSAADVGLRLGPRTPLHRRCSRRSAARSRRRAARLPRQLRQPLRALPDLAAGEELGATCPRTWPRAGGPARRAPHITGAGPPSRLQARRLDAQGLALVRRQDVRRGDRRSPKRVVEARAALPDGCAQGDELIRELAALRPHRSRSGPRTGRRLTSCSAAHAGGPQAEQHHAESQCDALGHGRGRRKTSRRIEDRGRAGEVISDPHAVEAELLGESGGREYLRRHPARTASKGSSTRTAAETAADIRGSPARTASDFHDGQTYPQGSVRLRLVVRTVLGASASRPAAAAELRQALDSFPGLPLE